MSTREPLDNISGSGGTSTDSTVTPASPTAPEKKTKLSFWESIKHFFGL
jgi:hypothetical protein